MRNRMIRRVVSLTAAIVALGLIAAGPAGAVGQTPSTIVGVGSDAMYRSGQQLDQLYNSTPGCEIIAPAGQTQLYDYACLADNPDTVTTENYTHDEAYSSYPLGGGSGVKQLCQGNPWRAFATPTSRARPRRRRPRTARGSTSSPTAVTR